jgi:hypothetical protein
VGSDRRGVLGGEWEGFVGGMYGWRIWFVRVKGMGSDGMDKGVGIDCNGFGGRRFVEILLELPRGKKLGGMVGWWFCLN